MGAEGGPEIKESLFREVNERIRSLNATPGIPVEETEFVCECGDADCTETVRMTLEEFESVTSHGGRFVVAVGHADPGRIVDAGAGYRVVERKDDFTSGESV
jgi:hypothetical protein